MTVVVIEPPSVLVVSVADAKKHLRAEEFTDDDVLIEGLIKAAVSHIDGPAGWLGRAVAPQTLELRVDEFSNCDIRIPYPPLAEVQSVKYDAEDGTSPTLPADTYRVVGSASAPRLALAYGKSWPALRWNSEAVRIRYTAGYPANPGVPAAIRHAILLIVGHWYANREAVVVGSVVNEVPMAAQALLQPFRVYG